MGLRKEVLLKGTATLPGSGTLWWPPLQQATHTGQMSRCLLLNIMSLTNGNKTADEHSSGSPPPPLHHYVVAAGSI